MPSVRQYASRSAELLSSRKLQRARPDERELALILHGPVMVVFTRRKQSEKSFAPIGFVGKNDKSVPTAAAVHHFVGKQEFKSRQAIWQVR
jgi:hypothetical protein